MTITIDKARAIELLEQAVAERGEDYVYPKYDDVHGGRCVYVHPETRQPDCLVALALNKAGVSVEDLELYGDRGGITAEREADGEEPTVEGASVLIAHLNALGVVTIDLDAKRVFEDAQSAQDGGKTWGAALCNAGRCVCGCED